MPPEIITETEGPFAGWQRWHARDEGRFSDLIGPMWFRTDAGGRARCRAPTEPRHANMQGFLHGGYLMAFVDQVMFGIARGSLIGVARAVTLTCNTEFIGAGRVGVPLDGTGEIVKETGKTIFLRGELTQEDEEEESGERLICTFSGVLRKFPRK